MENHIRLLMVEDNPDDAGLILRALERANFQLDSKVVSTKKEFIDELDAFPPDVILSDHHLPEFSSGQALEISRKKLPFVPFILVTGTASDEFAASIIRAGADDYLLKDNLRRLPTAILQAIEKKYTEESLLKSEANLRTIFENTDTAFVLLDIQFNILSFNYLAGHWTLKETNLVLEEGRNLFSYLPLQEPEAIKRLKGKVLSGNPIVHETQLPGGTSWYDVRMIPVKGTEGTVGGSKHYCFRYFRAKKK